MNSYASHNLANMERSYINQRAAGSYYNERFTFTGNDPRKGWRIPLNEIKYNEQRDEETGFGYFGARYMDHELMTMWLSVDQMADKYQSIPPPPLGGGRLLRGLFE